MTLLPRSRIPWISLPIVVALAASLPAGSRGDEPPPGEGAALMKELSAGFAALEKDVQLADRESIARDVTALRELAPRLRRLEPRAAAERTDDLARHVERFGELVDEIGDHAAQSRFGGASQALDALRTTCVSCHVRFRDDNAARGTHPARDNTIVGTVTLLDAEGGERSDRSLVLVFLESPAGAPPYVWQRGNARLSQKGRQFEPRVLPVVVGARVEFPNDDTIFHNVFSLSKTAPFDLGVYEPGQTASVLMERTGLVKVYCNIHPEMSASIVVLANPWYGLTDRLGRFVVGNVPAGEYTLRAWNALGAEARRPIRIESSVGGTVLEQSLALRETLRVIAHHDKFGKPYSGKYR